MLLQFKKLTIKKLSMPGNNDDKLRKIYNWKEIDLLTTLLREHQKVLFGRGPL